MNTSKMFKKHPSVVSYKSLDDLKTLKDWFYNFDSTRDLRSRAIDRVKALSSRGKVPHCIESTALLTSIYIRDVEPNDGIPSQDSYMIQLSYSMALIRFVNGLLDPLQQSNFAIPLHHLAKTLNVPSFFVELRHMSTHEKLPSLEILRIGCKEVLNWLYDNYWNKIDNLEIDDDETDEELVQQESDRVDNQVNEFNQYESIVVNNLKVYKKIRKQNIDIIYKYGNSTEFGIKYWKAIKNIKKTLTTAEDPVFLVLLYKQFMIKPDKDWKYVSLLYKLYSPLFDELGFDFKWNLFQRLCKLLQPLENTTTRLYKRLKFEIDPIQVKYWILEFVKEFNKSKRQEWGPYTNKSDLINKVLDSLEETEDVFVWEKLQEIINLPRVKITYENLVNTTKLKNYEDVPNLDSILGMEPEPKRKKIEVFFELHENWEPQPFGTLI